MSMCHFYCDICRVSSSSEGNHRDHMNGKQHKKKIRVLSITGGVSHEPMERDDVSASRLVASSPLISSSSLPYCEQRMEPVSESSTSNQFTRKCELCLVQFSGPCSADDHFASERHKKKERARIEAQTPTKTKKFCPICCVFLDTVDQFLVHNISPKHLENEEKAKLLRKESRRDYPQEVQIDQSVKPKGSDREVDEIDADKGAHAPSPNNLYEIESNGRRSLSPDSRLSVPGPPAKRTNNNTDSTRFCELCSKVFSGPLNASQHYASEKHRKKARQNETANVGLPRKPAILGLGDSVVNTEMLSIALTGSGLVHPNQLEVQHTTNFEDSDVDRVAMESIEYSEKEDIDVSKSGDNSDSDSFASAVESLGQNDDFDELDIDKQKDDKSETRVQFLDQEMKTADNSQREASSHLTNEQHGAGGVQDYRDTGDVQTDKVKHQIDSQSVEDATVLPECAESNETEGKNSITVKQFNKILEDFRKQYEELAEKKKVEWHNKSRDEHVTPSAADTTGVTSSPVAYDEMEKKPGVIKRIEPHYDYCRVCSVALTSPSHASQHRAGKKHKKKMQLETWNTVDADTTNDFLTSQYTNIPVRTVYDEIVATNEDMLETVLIISPQEQCDLQSLKQNE